MTSNSSLSVGVIGTGLLGTRLAEAVVAHPGCDLVALSDISPRSLQKATERLSGDPSTYEDHRNLLQQEELDAVVIATPHTTHFDQIFDALESGHHVLCEKPLCTDVDDARRIETLANEVDKTVMVGYQRRVELPFTAAKEHLNGSSSHPHFVTAEITQPWIDDALESWRGNPSLSGGGFLYDTGSHLLDAVLWLTDATPVSVSAEMTFADDEQRVDKDASLTIKFDTGAIASLAMSAGVPRTRELIRVWTDETMVQLDGREWSSRQLTVVKEDGQEISPYLGLDDGPGKVAAFHETVVGGAPCPAPVSQAIALTAVTEAAYESARTGRPVSLDIDDVAPTPTSVN